MAIDQFENLPGIIAELQDGNLAISEIAGGPRVLVLGTSDKGPAGVPTRVVRNQESKAQFGINGSLIRGMLEARAGGASDTFLYRIGTRSAILTGVGTDDQGMSPTSIETLVKDGSAADLYLVRYEPPAALGPNAVLGRLRIKNVLDEIVYDSNPGGTLVDTGEVIVSGTFDGITAVGDAGDDDDYVSMRDVAGDRTVVTGEVTGTTYLNALPEVTTFNFTGLTGDTFDVMGSGLYVDFKSALDAISYYAWFNVTDGGETQADPAPGGTGIQVDVLEADTATQVAVKFAAAVDALAAFISAVPTTPTATVTNAANGTATDATDGTSAIVVAVTQQGRNPEVLNVPLDNTNILEGTIVVYVGGTEISTASWTLTSNSPLPDELDLVNSITVGGAVTVDYEYDANLDANLRDGSDGNNLSKMELYEALEDAYLNLESQEIDVVIPMEAFLDDLNVADGDTVVLKTDIDVADGAKYPVPDSAGDALGLLHKEEFEGTIYYFWDIDDDGIAEIWPVGVGAASATTKIDGTALAAADFVEVNFAYQTANFCFRLSLNDNFCLGVVGTSMPVSSSVKDVSNWIGTDETRDANDDVTANGTGLLGNKLMAGTTSQDPGFFGTFTGNMPVGDLDTNSDIIKDRGDNRVDIGKYLSVVAMPMIFFNDFDSTGNGYQANMCAYYGGFFSSLPAKSAPTNKSVLGLRSPFKIFKTKLNQLAGKSYITTRERKNRVKITDAPTAARPGSDYERLSTVRIVAGVIDLVRDIGDPYIGEPNTKLRREALEKSIRKELVDYQKDGNLNRFDVKVTATPTQQIQGDQIVELELVPAFETRKITVITSLAKQ